MNRKRPAFVRFCILGLSGVFLANAITTGGSVDPRLEKILADWQKRQHAVESIHYQIEGEYKVPRGSYTQVRVVNLRHKKKSEVGVAPEEDISGPIGLNLLLDFAKERFRVEKRNQSFNVDSCKIVPEVITFTFDGKQIRSHMPREKNPDMGPKQPEMGIVKGNVKNEVFLLECKPIFIAHGRIYTPTEQIVPGQMRNEPDSNGLHIHGTSVHEGRACLIVRTQAFQLGGNVGFEEYWVDPERESTIVRFSTYSGKKLTCDQDLVIHYKHVPDGWFPCDWRWTFFLQGKILNYQDMRVAKMEANPIVSDADFGLEGRTGMIVREVDRHPSADPFSRPKSDISVYRLEENGKRTYVPDPFHNPGDQYNKSQTRMGLLPWLFVTVTAILGGLWMWVRHRSRNKHPLSDSR